MEGLDYFLELFNHPIIDLFPRKAMAMASRGQVEVKNKEELEELFLNSYFIDCFLQTHTQSDKEKGLLYLVFIDIDFENLKRAIKVRDKINHHLFVNYGFRPYIQYSGNRGFHFLIPIKPVFINPPTMAREFLKYLQLKFSLGYCDPQILGDVVRLCRIPNTWNSKGIFKDKDAFVKIIQEWDGQRIDVEEEWEEFRMEKLQEEIEKRKKRASSITVNLRDKIRPEVQELMRKAKEGYNLTHHQRLAILFELINNGLSDDEIIAVFSHLPDFDERKTRYMIEHARKRGYKPFSRRRLKEIAV